MSENNNNTAASPPDDEIEKARKTFNVDLDVSGKDILQKRDAFLLDYSSTQNFIGYFSYEQLGKIFSAIIKYSKTFRNTLFFHSV